MRKQAFLIENKRLYPLKNVLKRFLNPYFSARKVGPLLESTFKRETMICQYCGKMFRGRTDKKYCSSSCKNAFHQHNPHPARAYLKTIERSLRQNHAVLAQLPWEKERILNFSKIELLAKGFDFRLCTGVFTSNKGRQFFYVYDFAWIENENETISILRKQT